MWQRTEKFIKGAALGYSGHVRESQQLRWKEVGGASFAALPDTNPSKDSYVSEFDVKVLSGFGSPLISLCPPLLWQCVVAVISAPMPCVCVCVRVSGRVAPCVCARARQCKEC